MLEATTSYIGVKCVRCSKLRVRLVAKLPAQNNVYVNDPGYNRNDALQKSRNKLENKQQKQTRHLLRTHISNHERAHTTALTHVVRDNCAQRKQLNTEIPKTRPNNTLTIKQTLCMTAGACRKPSTVERRQLEQHQCRREAKPKIHEYSTGRRYVAVAIACQETDAAAESSHRPAAKTTWTDLTHANVCQEDGILAEKNNRVSNP